MTASRTPLSGGRRPGADAPRILEPPYVLGEAREGHLEDVVGILRS